MSRVSRRAGTKTKVIPGNSNQKPPQYRHPPGTKLHPRKKRWQGGRAA